MALVLLCPKVTNSDLTLLAFFKKCVKATCQRVYKTIISTGKVIHGLTVWTVGCTVISGEPRQRGVKVSMETESPIWDNVVVPKVGIALCQHHDDSRNAQGYHWTWSTRLAMAQKPWLANSLSSWSFNYGYLLFSEKSEEVKKGMTSVSFHSA